MLHRLPVEWASKLLEDAEEVTDAAVETMTVCRPDRCETNFTHRHFSYDFNTFFVKLYSAFGSSPMFL